MKHLRGFNEELSIEDPDKSNEVFTFRVGKHIFEGKLTKIKKVQ